MSGARPDVSHIRSPRDPMTPEEREEVIRQLREEAAAIDQVLRETGGPWEGLDRGWADDLDDDAA